MYNMETWENQEEKQEQSQQISRTTKTEYKPTKMETIKRQRQLTCQIIEEIGQLWEETQREKTEIDDLKTKTEWQQEVINRLTAEKHEQDLLIQRLRSQIENVNDKLNEKKDEATQEKMQLQKMWAEIHQEKECLEKRHIEIINERHKWEMIKYDKTQSWKESNEPMEQIKRETKVMQTLMADRLLSLIKKNKKEMLEAKQEKEQMEIIMEDIKQELKRNKKDISQHKEQIEHIKHNMNVNIHKMKRMWTKNQRDPAVQEVESRERQEEGKGSTDTVKIKLCRIKEEMEKLWDVLEDSEQQLEMSLREKQEPRTEIGPMEDMTSQEQRQDTDANMTITQWETEMKGGMQRQKQDMQNKLAQIQSERDETERIENQFEEDNMETAAENQINTGMRRVILEVEEIRKMLSRVREDTENRRNFTEEKSQMKWMNFQAKKKRQELDQRLEKTMKERDELEIVKIKIQRQKLEVEQKLEDTITIILTMGEVKAHIEKAAAEINNTWEEMLKAQRTMEENKEEVKKYMDKLTSMKAQLSRWVLTESTMNTSKLQEPLKKIDRDTLTFAEVTEEADQHQSEDTKDEEHINSECKLTEEQHFFAMDIKEEQNIFLQTQTEINEGTLMGDQTELVINIREKAEVERQISKLKAREEEIKEQMKDALENVEEKNQEIKRLIMEINDLHSRRPETESGLELTVRESEYVEKGETGLLKETESKDILRVNNVFKHEVQMQKMENGNKVKTEEADECDLMSWEVEKQKESLQPREDLQTHTEKRDGGSYKSADIERLRTEIYRTQEIIRLMKLELENQAEECNIDKDKGEDSEIEGLLQDMKQFQELLKMVKTAMMQNEKHLKEEISDMKLMKTAAKKQKRELDQRLEKTLRERDELDILKIKMQRQIEMTEQKLEKMAKVKSSIEIMTAHARKKNEDIEIIMMETKAKLEDLNYKVKDTKQKLDNSYLLISQERANLEKFKAEIRQQKDPAFENSERESGDIKKHVGTERNTEMDTMTKTRMGKEIEEMKNKISRLKSENEKMEENIKLITDSLDQKNSENEQLKKEICEQMAQKTEREDIEMLRQQTQGEMDNVRRARQQVEAEIKEMNSLRESMERQKQELDDRVQTTERAIREMELLKSELEIKKKESEQIFRKSRRQREESDIMWKEIQRENKLLRRESKIKKRELDKRLEKTMRERDELEMLRIKLQRQKEEQADGKQSIKDKTYCFQVYKEHKEQSVEKQEVKSTREQAEMVLKSSKVQDSITDLQNMRQKIHVHLQIIKNEMGVLKNVSVHLGEQRECLKAVKAESNTVRDNMNIIKSQIKIEFEKLTIQAKDERDAMVHMWYNIEKKDRELEITLQNVKRERREMEVLKSELEIEKRENQKVFHKSIRKEQELKEMWAEVEGEKDALKRETGKRKKELSQRLERIIRERDELEIMKLKLQSVKDESKSGTKELRMSTVKKVPNQTEKHWELIHTCMEKYKLMKKQNEDLKAAIKDEKQQMDAQAKIMAQAKEEMEEIKRQMACVLNNLKQKLREEEKERIKKKMLVQRKREVGNESEFLEVKAIALEIEQEEETEKLQTTQTEEAKREEQGPDEETEKKVKTELLETGLMKISDVTEKDDVKDQWRTNFVVEDEALDQVKAERRMLEKEKDRIKGERSELKLREDQLMNKIQASETLRDKLEKTKDELQKKQDEADRLFDEINGEKTNIKDLTLQVQTERQEANAGE
ncbi:trichohyalin-like [Pempheris klunzingeri]|uniref:trichohyalin-like n=1 Tax=Pempheris klunzingeri TaxID=3127111 RepID=UPI00397F5032